MQELGKYMSKRLFDVTIEYNNDYESIFLIPRYM
jgi:hypothetical protein